MSRATLAECFRNTVGTPPMTYLTEWRLALAADLLRQSDATLNAVARQVGYGSGFALSSAFKRVYGISPQEHHSAAPTRWARCHVRLGGQRDRRSNARAECGSAEADRGAA
ncbi:hypothetical protein GCM10010412_050030 [Nonomuraea recticatena]|uniref:HTH araC/xylS-type domain-containing protein n=1 Tax=Nonomuraea recticatena TaxID=46178 RepID=A0ABN3SCE8_9ACTN